MTKVPKIDMDLELGGFAFSPPDYRPDGETRKRPPRLVLKMQYHGDKGGPIGAFYAHQLIGGPVFLKLLTDSEDREWEGFGRMGKLESKPPTGDRARESGSTSALAFSVTIEDRAGHSLGDLMELRLAMARDDQGVARVQVQFWQQDLPWEGEPDGEEGEGLDF